MPSYWFAKDDTPENFNNGTWAEKHTLDFEAPAQGDYLIVVSCQAQSLSTSDSVLVRAQLDDSITIMEGSKEPQNATAGRYMLSFASVYLAESLASGSHHVDVDAYAEDTGESCDIREIKIAVIRLDDWLDTSGMYGYAATEGITTTGSGGSYGTIQTLTFTPDQQGDYLVLGSCELDVNSTTTSGILRLNYDSASEYIPVNSDGHITVEAKDSTDYTCFVWGGIINIPASEKTILMEGTRTSQTSNVRKRRIIAIRLAAMHSEVEPEEEAAEESVQTDVYTEKTTLTPFTPSETLDYWIIGGIVSRASSVFTTNVALSRLNHSIGTNTEIISEAAAMAKDSTSPADSFPHFTNQIKELTTTSQTFKWEYKNYNANYTHYARATFIIAVPLTVAAPPPAAYPGKGIDRGINRGIL